MAFGGLCCDKNSPTQYTFASADIITFVDNKKD